MNLCKTLLTAALCLVAATSASESCLIFAGGRLFDLCAFTKPITVSFDVIPFLHGIDFIFSLNGNNVPNCENGTADAWLKMIDHETLQCFGVIPAEAKPTYSLSKQAIDLHVLTITYDGKPGASLQINLYCNPKGKHDAKIDFFVSFLDPNILSISGYSYHACPVPA